MFYNTGIPTYVWILANKKSAERRGLTQLIDGSTFFQKMRKSLGSKRRYLSDDDISSIVKFHGSAANAEFSKLLPNSAFGYTTITIERPLKLNFQVSPERLAFLTNQLATKKLDAEFPVLERALRSVGDKLFLDRNEFQKAISKALKAHSIVLYCQTQTFRKSESRHSSLGLPTSRCIGSSVWLVSGKSSDVIYDIIEVPFLHPGKGRSTAEFLLGRP